MHYKVCDDGEYFFSDEHGNVILHLVNSYVPSILDMSEDSSAYHPEILKKYGLSIDNRFANGNYLVIKITEDGIIENWNYEVVKEYLQFEINHAKFELD